MNPVKLLASRNLLVAIAILGVVFVAFVLLQTHSGAVADTMPSADLLSVPPAPTGNVVPLTTILTAYKQSRSTAVRKYRDSPFTTQVDAVIPVNKSGWAEAVTVGGGHATLYFTESQASAPEIVAGHAGTFICGDWQSGVSGAVLMYGCGAIPVP